MVTETTFPPEPAVRRRRINWRQEYLHASIALMTAFWITPWITLSLNWFLEISLSGALGLSAAHLIGSTLLVRWMIHRRATSASMLLYVLVLMWIAAGFTVLVTPALMKSYGGQETLTLRDLFFFDQENRVPAGPLLIGWVLVLWWRGYQLGDTYLTLVRASFGMRLGILSFLIAALAIGPTLRPDLLALIPPFFFLGLLSSSLARADSLALDRAGHQTAFGRGWILSLAAIALLLTAASYIVALWLAGIDIERAAWLLWTIAEGLLTLFFLVLSPLLLLVQIIYNTLRSLMPDRLSTPINITNSDGSASNSSSDIPYVSDLLNLMTNAFFVAIILLLVVLLIAFIWFVLLGRLERKESEDEERETLGTAEVMGGMRSTLRNNLRRLANALGLLRQFGVGRDLFAALTIRRIYARMEHLAGKRGYPRTLSETPNEYRRELFQAYPGLNEDVERITRAYIAVRYGDVPENNEELQAVRTAWSHLQESHDPALNNR